MIVKTSEKQLKNYITLQQFLKLKNIASTGGEAKILIQTLDIEVNGEKETRRGRKLYKGDVVLVDGKEYVVNEWLLKTFH